MGGLDGNGVHYRVHCHACQLFLLLQGDAELIECVEQLGIHLVERFGALLFHRSGIIAYGLEINGGHVEVSPCRRREREPVTVRLQSEIKQPFRLAFFARYEPDHILVESHGDDVGVDVGYETVFVVALCDVVDHLLRRLGFLVVLFHVTLRTKGNIVYDTDYLYVGNPQVIYLRTTGRPLRLMPVSSLSPTLREPDRG